MERRKFNSGKSNKNEHSHYHSNEKKEQHKRFTKDKEENDKHFTTDSKPLKKNRNKNEERNIDDSSKSFSKYEKDKTVYKPYKKQESDDRNDHRDRKKDRLFSKQKPTFSKVKHKASAKKDNSIRLNRYLANAGICSRREADEYIKAGLVKVNGVVVTELGTKVQPTDEIKFNNEAIKIENKVYILLNKPKDYVTTTTDERGRRTVMELIRGACREKVFPVGRLDRNTTGVLLFTNDGDLAAKLTHPKYSKKKIYHVFLDKKLKKEDMDKLVEGINDGDDFLRADVVSFVDPADKTQVGVEIHTGQNRVIRRMFEALNYKVVKLDRVYFAGLTKKSLPRGRWRFLTPTEINMLKMGAFE
ncbi:MAG: hypothetical protein Fur0028_03520 [Bacteroidales bacterium]